MSVAMEADRSAKPSPQWQPRSAADRIARSVIYIAAVIAIIWSIRTIEVIPEFLYDAPAQTYDLFSRMWPFDWSRFWSAIWPAMIETFHIATLGTLLALILSLPLAFLAAQNFNSNVFLAWVAKFIFVSTRSVNSLVWALLFVAILGPGPLAGVLAIAFRSIGFVGKLFGEALEDAKRGPIEALTATGAPRALVLIKGYWPQVEPAFWSVAFLRWDINIRESAVLGLVGAGGIGVALDASLENLYWDEVGLILALILVVVIFAEVLTSWIRSRII